MAQKQGAQFTPVAEQAGGAEAEVALTTEAGEFRE